MTLGVLLDSKTCVGWSDNLSTELPNSIRPFIILSVSHYFLDFDPSQDDLISFFAFMFSVATTTSICCPLSYCFLHLFPHLTVVLCPLCRLTSQMCVIFFLWTLYILYHFNALLLCDPLPSHYDAQFLLLTSSRTYNHAYIYIPITFSPNISPNTLTFLLYFLHPSTLWLNT